MVERQVQRFTVDSEPARRRRASGGPLPSQRGTTGTLDRLLVEVSHPGVQRELRYPSLPLGGVSRYAEPPPQRPARSRRRGQRRRRSSPKTATSRRSRQHGNKRVACRHRHTLCRGEMSLVSGRGQVRTRQVVHPSRTYWRVWTSVGARARSNEHASSPRRIRGHVLSYASRVRDGGGTLPSGGGKVSADWRVDREHADSWKLQELWWEGLCMRREAFIAVLLVAVGRWENTAGIHHADASVHHNEPDDPRATGSSLTDKGKLIGS